MESPESNAIRFQSQSRSADMARVSSKREKLPELGGEPFACASTLAGANRKTIPGYRNCPDCSVLPEVYRRADSES
jgi:rubredoxin